MVDFPNILRVDEIFFAQILLKYNLDLLPVILREKLIDLNILRDGVIPIDTPRHKCTRILGSLRPLKTDTLQCLSKRWDSPQATLGMPYPSWIAPNSFFI